MTTGLSSLLRSSACRPMNGAVGEKDEAMNERGRRETERTCL